MYRQIFIVGLIAAFCVACEDEAPAEAEVPSEETEQVEEVEEVEEPEEAAAPRMNPTETPEMDQVGQLPDGIGIAAGESAPEVSATGADGEEVQLSGLVEDEAILVFFYRGGWCPFCNFQVREMTEANDAFAERGVRPVAISVDRMEKAAETSATYEIPFPVLSDPDLTVHQAFSVTHEATAEEVERLAGFGMDLEEASGEDHNTFAVPAVFIIDSEGTIRWAHANLDYRVRPSTEQLLSVIDELF